MTDINRICGYDPQRLLEYKPETMAEWADRRGWCNGGTVTGRWTGRVLEPDYMAQSARIPHLYPGTKLEMLTYPDIDFSVVEARILASLSRKRVPTFFHYEMGATSFREAMERNARFEPMLRQRQALLKAQIDAVMTNVMLDVYVDMPRREARISRLVHSRDPRQRKRGRRLREKSYPTIRWGEPTRMPLPYEDLKEWFNTKLGEPYDPERYRKD